MLLCTINGQCQRISKFSFTLRTILCTRILGQICTCIGTKFTQVHCRTRLPDSNRSIRTCRGIHIMDINHPSNDETTQILESARLANSKLMKSNLKLLLAIRERDYAIDKLRQKLRVYHTQCQKMNVPLKGSHLLVDKFKPDSDSNVRT